MKRTHIVTASLACKNSWFMNDKNHQVTMHISGTNTVLLGFTFLKWVRHRHITRDPVQLVSRLPAKSKSIIDFGQKTWTKWEAKPTKWCIRQRSNTEPISRGFCSPYYSRTERSPVVLQLHRLERGFACYFMFGRNRQQVIHISAPFMFVRIVRRWIFPDALHTHFNICMMYVCL